MIGIIVILAISWILLYFFEKRNLQALGVLPLTKRLKQFVTGFLITASICVLAQCFEALLQSSKWVLNESITPQNVLKSFWWDIKSVLTEELIYRGALLYILIQKIGSMKSILLSAVAFGVYHWFSYGVLGNVMAMIFVFIGTGLMGYAWALAFSKTNSIMLPFGLHLGWNSVYNTIFSKGPLGESVLIQKGGVELTEWFSLLNFVTGLIVVPVIVIIYVRCLVHEEKKQDIISAEPIKKNQRF